MEFAAELETVLREFAASGDVEVRENGLRPARFSDLSWEVRGAGEKPLLHLWSEQFNLTRRVLAIADHTEGRLVLAVERFGRLKPARLEFLVVDFQRGARELSRTEFCDRLRQILAEQFPDESLESLTVSPDLEHSLSGSYARGLLRRGSTYTAFLAVPDGEPADSLGRSLTFALLWLDRARHSLSKGTLNGLRIILPADGTQAVAHACGALAGHLNVELFELDSSRQTLQRIDARLAGNLDTWLVRRPDCQLLIDQARPSLDPIVALAPKAITLHPVPQSREVWLRFYGLAVVRWHEGRVFFVNSDAREEVTAISRGTLERLLNDLQIYRHPLASDTRNILYRAQPERWLEAVVRQDITRIDASLDPRFVYSQVFVNAGCEHGILDLLAVTLTGRLAVLELKATEHIHLPLQAADYWLRIRRHLEQGDLQRHGFFPGIELQPLPPVVYLVAPALRFHPATDTILRYLNPQLEMVRIGLTESWRRGLRVILRH